MLKIRLKRTGKRKQPSYRFVITEVTKPRDGRSIEEIGYYNPMSKSDSLKFDKDRAKYWLEKGAQPSDTVAQIFVREGILEKLKKGSKQSPGKAKKKNVETEESAT